MNGPILSNIYSEDISVMTHEYILGMDHVRQCKYGVTCTRLIALVFVLYFFHFPEASGSTSLDIFYHNTMGFHLRSPTVGVQLCHAAVIMLFSFISRAAHVHTCILKNVKEPSMQCGNLA